MRETQVTRRWHTVSSGWSGKVRLEKLRLTGLEGFSSTEISLTPGLTLLAGINSSGKSRLLRAIANQQQEHTNQTVDLMLGGLGDASSAYTYVYVDFFELLGRQWQLAGQPDVEEQVDSAGESAWRPSDVKSASYILGRTYAEIWMSELESIFPVGADEFPSYRPDVVPHFRVKYEGLEEYRNSPHLSRGELSALTLLWVLRSATHEDLLLLDEPDQMLSPMSADRAINIVATRSSERKVPSIVATHAYSALANAPKETLVLLSVGSNGVTSIAAPKDQALWKALRVAPPKLVFFLVEDEMARLLLRLFLNEVKYPYRELSEIILAGGEGEVRKIQHLPKSVESSFVMAGIFDGDQTVEPGSRNLLKLPGSWSPENGALQIISQYGEQLQIDSGAYSESIDYSAGKDYHDVFSGLAADLGTSTEELLIKAWRFWVKNDDTGKGELERFHTSIAGIVPPI